MILSTIFLLSRINSTIICATYRPIPPWKNKTFNEHTPFYKLDFKCWLNSMINNLKIRITKNMVKMQYQNYSRSEMLDKILNKIDHFRDLCSNVICHVCWKMYLLNMFLFSLFLFDSVFDVSNLDLKTMPVACKNIPGKSLIQCTRNVTGFIFV